MPSNLDRITRTERMIMSRGPLFYDPHDQRANLVDVLTDLRHWAAKNKLDWQAAVDTSLMHFDSEATEEAELAGTVRKFQVHVSREVTDILSTTLEIEATSAEEAREKAEAMIDSGKAELSFEGEADNGTVPSYEITDSATGETVEL